MRETTIVVTCPMGVPPFLREELLELGLPVIAEGVASVQTRGTFAEAMRLNLHVRTGHRVLWLVDEFRARSPEEFYARIVHLPWEDHLDEDGYFTVSSSVRTQAVRDSRFVNLKCKDGVADRMRQARGRRPDSGPEAKGAAIFVLWQEDEVSVYLDTTGETLARRGYRKMPWKAPMQETLAAATILATGWRDTGPLVNPMCGSGTLAIEAALLGLGKPPGLLRREFAFMHLKDFDAPVWDELRRAAEDASHARLAYPVVATDMDPAAIRAARANAAGAGVEDLIEWGACDFGLTNVPAPADSSDSAYMGGGTVILNPEYGERMGRVEELGETYARIGDFFKQRCQGYRGYVFTGNPGLAKRIGLRTKRRIPFWNGKIECRLLEYELYRGTKRLPASLVQE